MFEPILKIFMDDEDDSNSIKIEFREDNTDVVKQLGILEWAKAAILRTIAEDNALAHYNDEED